MPLYRTRSLPDRSDQFLNMFHSIFFHVLFNAPNHFQSRLRPKEISSSYRYCTRSSQYKFQSVLSCNDSSHSNNRNFRLPAPPDKPSSLPPVSPQAPTSRQSCSPEQTFCAEHQFSFQSSVLIKDTASAPPASAALATSVISVTLGVSFMMIG